MRAIRTFSKVARKTNIKVPMNHMFAVPQQLRLYSTDDSNFHDDFKAKVKLNTPQDLTEEVKKQIVSDKIVLFMKGNPLAPECGFSRAVCQVLNFYGFKYSSFNVNMANAAEYKEAIKKVTNWPTFPQVFVNGELIGGCDIVVNMHRENQLKEVLEKSGAEKVKKD